MAVESVSAPRRAPESRREERAEVKREQSNAENPEPKESSRDPRSSLAEA
jgi:hypothetical protein